MKNQRVEFITPLIKFVETCPFLNGEGKVVIIPFDPNTIDGNGISYNGLSAPVIKRDVTGGIRVGRQANFSLCMQRKLIDETSSEEATRFITEFEQWVLEESLMGRAPRFGVEDYDETLWADGGFLWGITRDGQVPFATYQTNLHVKYEVLFEREDD